MEIQIMWSQNVRARETQKKIRELVAKVGKSNANAPGTRAQQTTPTKEARNHEK